MKAVYIEEHGGREKLIYGEYPSLEKTMSKPNLFQIATKELSQDGFFTWLIQWADSTNQKYDKELNITAKSFVKLLLNNTTDIMNVSAGRQWNNIDIWAEVNDDTFIAIEDKTNTGEHSEQLERYKQIAQKHYKNKRDNLFLSENRK